jgi:protein SCO1/2
LLTAADDAVLELAVVLGVRYKKAGGGDFAHSNLITVLDSGGVPVYRQSGLDRPPDEALDKLREMLAHSHH